MHFRSFLKIKVQTEVYLLGLLKLQNILGCLKVLIFFGAKRYILNLSL